MTEGAGMRGGEVFRFSRGDDVRIYHLHVVAGGTELWRVNVRPGQPDSQTMEDRFKSADVAARYFQEIERTLTAGGWREISRFQV